MANLTNGEIVEIGFMPIATNLVDWIRSDFENSLNKLLSFCAESPQLDSFNLFTYEAFQIVMTLLCEKCINKLNFEK